MVKGADELPKLDKKADDLVNQPSDEENIDIPPHKKQKNVQKQIKVRHSRNMTSITNKPPTLDEVPKLEKKEDALTLNKSPQKYIDPLK